ncbi:MAG: hypothetical protein KKA19_01545 [Candidatus Margulisbacteria bacterium]|nr:hypothetical protein [Candidatus Margulisiibacteriota bacterium]
MNDKNKEYMNIRKELIKLAEQKGFLMPEDILQKISEAEDIVKITEELIEAGVNIIENEAASLGAYTVAEEKKTNLVEELADGPALSRYLHRLGNIQKLSEAEKNALISKAKQGDENAVQSLLEAHQPLAVYCAKKYLGKGLLLYDLIQEANYGLLQAIKKYSPIKRVEFAKFASGLMRQAIAKSLKNYSHAMLVPEDIVRIIKKVHKAKAILAQKFKREPKIEEIAEELQMPNEKIQDILKTTAMPLSLDAPYGENNTTGLEIGKQNTLGEAIKEEFDSFKGMLSESEKEYLLDIITELNPLEQQIISLYYGLIDGQEWSVKEIAAFLNIHEDQIREMKQRALDVLQEQSKKNKYIST